ncbi:MAG: ABC transporter ATP-binding protein [Candidatus Heimdallarchaeota archaeon]
MIEIKNLSKQFDSFTAIGDISFRINEGEIFAYLGPNGAGKTTTVNILATLLSPSSGEVRIAGYDVTKEGLKVRRLIGYAPDDFGLYPTLTIFGNLDFSGALYGIRRNERRKKIRELLEFFTLEDKKNTPTAALSKGMKQKVNLARALIHNPKILLLDEPTSGLDPVMAKEVMSLISRLKKEGKTILMTTHLLSRAEKVCDTVAVINKGKILHVGNLIDVKTRLKRSTLEDVYFSLLGEDIEFRGN